MSYSFFLQYARYNTNSFPKLTHRYTKTNAIRLRFLSNHRAQLLMPRVARYKYIEFFCFLLIVFILTIHKIMSKPTHPLLKSNWSYLWQHEYRRRLLDDGWLAMVGWFILWCRLHYWPHTRRLPTFFNSHFNSHLLILTCYRLENFPQSSLPNFPHKAWFDPHLHGR